MNNIIYTVVSACYISRYLALSLLFIRAKKYVQFGARWGKRERDMYMRDMKEIRSTHPTVGSPLLLCSNRRFFLGGGLSGGRSGTFHNNNRSTVTLGDTELFIKIK